MVNRSYSYPCDVWAAAVVMYGLIDGTFPFQSSKDIMTKKPNKPHGISDEGSKLLLNMLTKKAEKRLTMQECCDSEYLRNMALKDQNPGATLLADDAPGADEKKDEGAPPMMEVVDGMQN